MININGSIVSAFGGPNGLPLTSADFETFGAFHAFLISQVCLLSPAEIIARSLVTHDC